MNTFAWSWFTNARRRYKLISGTQKTCCRDTWYVV